MKAKLVIAVILSLAVFMSLASVLLPEPPPTQVIGAPEILALALPLREALWNFRLLDVLGQLALLITGTFGVLVLVKERR